MGPTVSVAMTTMNGDRYLARQLATIGAQSLPPTELVVGDDGSTDATLGRLAGFARQADFPVRVEVATESRGVVANMERVVARARGDLVALADQDDLWRVDKLERLRDAAVSAGAALVFSDAELVDEHDQPTGDRLWPALDFTDRQRRRLTRTPPGPLLRHNCSSGCTMLVTRAVRDLAIPFPDALEDPVAPMLHDRWMALLAACTGPVVALRDPLTSYRIHAAQTTGAARDRRTRQFADQAVTGVAAVRAVAAARLRQLTALMERLAERDVEPTAVVQGQLADVLRHQAVRAGLGDRRVSRIGSVAGEIARGGYRRWTYGSATGVVDLIRPAGT